MRSEVASYGERPSSGPRAIAGVVEVLLMLGVSVDASERRRAANPVRTPAWRRG